jgi:prepilin-type N-terminal cleavage/methylation domain-containing protein
MKINKMNQKGFSLIEVLISMAIFSLIVGSILLFSVRTIEAHTKSQAMGNSLENARFAIEKLNKKVRTSSGINGDDGMVTNFLTESKEIFFVDNVDQTKQCFKFENKKLYFDTVDAGSDAVDCSHGDFNDFKALVGSDDGKTEIEGFFLLRQTNEALHDRGFVRTVITIKHNDASALVAEKSEFTIQSAVSLRDY